MQYTTAWAKEYLRENPKAKSVRQLENGEVLSYWCYPEDYINGRFTLSCAQNHSLGIMLEHPDGWQNSKVTREDL